MDGDYDEKIVPQHLLSENGYAYLGDTADVDESVLNFVGEEAVE